MSNFDNIQSPDEQNQESEQDKLDLLIPPHDMICYSHVDIYEILKHIPNYTKEIESKIDQWAKSYNSNLEYDFLRQKQSQSFAFEKVYNTQQKYEDDIYKYYKLTNTLLETIKSFKQYNQEIHKQSQSGGLEFIIESIERIISWIMDHDQESNQQFNFNDNLSELHSKDFNEHKSFLMEILLNVANLSQSFLNKSKSEENQNESVEFQDIDCLATLKGYYNTLPSLLRRLSEIFENDEIKRICNDGGNNDNSENRQGSASPDNKNSNIKNDKSDFQQNNSSGRNSNNFQTNLNTAIINSNSHSLENLINNQTNIISEDIFKNQDYEQSNSNKANKNSGKESIQKLNEININIEDSINKLSNNASKDSLQSTYIDRLRNEIIRENKKEKNNTGRRTRNTDQDGLKALDESIQSINSQDLYKYEQSPMNSNKSDTQKSESDATSHTISQDRLNGQMDKHHSLKRIISSIQDNPTLENKIIAYEYKQERKYELEQNNVKIEDLLKIDVSKSELEPHDPFDLKITLSEKKQDGPVEEIIDYRSDQEENGFMSRNQNQETINEQDNSAETSGVDVNYTTATKDRTDKQKNKISEIYNAYNYSLGSKKYQGKNNISTENDRDDIHHDQDQENRNHPNIKSPNFIAHKEIHDNQIQFEDQIVRHTLNNKTNSKNPSSQENKLKDKYKNTKQVITKKTSPEATSKNKQQEKLISSPEHQSNPTRQSMIQEPNVYNRGKRNNKDKSVEFSNSPRSNPHSHKNQAEPVLYQTNSNSVEKDSKNINISISNSVTNSPNNNVNIKISLNSDGDVMSDGEERVSSITKQMMKKPATVKNRNPTREKNRADRQYNVQQRIEGKHGGGNVNGIGNESKTRRISSRNAINMSDYNDFSNRDMYSNQDLDGSKRHNINSPQFKFMDDQPSTSNNNNSISMKDQDLSNQNRARSVNQSKEQKRVKSPGQNKVVTQSINKNQIQNLVKARKPTTVRVNDKRRNFSFNNEVLSKSEIVGMREKLSSPLSFENRQIKKRNMSSIDEDGVDLRMNNISLQMKANQPTSTQPESRRRGQKNRFKETVYKKLDEKITNLGNTVIDKFANQSYRRADIQAMK